jgi:hypothetical protein
MLELINVPPEPPDIKQDQIPEFLDFVEEVMEE